LQPIPLKSLQWPCTPTAICTEHNLPVVVQAYSRSSFKTRLPSNAWQEMLFTPIPPKTTEKQQQQRRQPNRQKQAWAPQRVLAAGRLASQLLSSLPFLMFPSLKGPLQLPLQQQARVPYSSSAAAMPAWPHGSCLLREGAGFLRSTCASLPS